MKGVAGCEGVDVGKGRRGWGRAGVWEEVGSGVVAVEGWAGVEGVGWGVVNG